MMNESVYFEKSMGNLFYEIINSFSFGKITSIVEVAPGFRSKISYALEKLDFDGDLYVIDSNEKVLEFIKKKYHEIIPKANVITINLELVDSIKLLPQNIDLFLANHPIDDMIMAKYIKKNNIENLFDNNLSSQKSLFDCWKELDNNKELLDRIINEVYLDFSKLFTNINFKGIVLSNYRSWYYLDIDSIPESHAKKVFDKLKKDFKYLNDIGNIIDNNNFIIDEINEKAPNIKETILNKDSWLVGSYKTREI